MIPEADVGCLVDPDAHASGRVHETWRWMRAHRPVSWHPPGDLPGFWSVTRHHDVRTVYADPGRFSSADGVLLRPRGLGPDPGAGRTLALSDPPLHRDLRALVVHWFASRGLADRLPEIRATVVDVVGDALALDGCDFAHDVAARLTMTLVCQLLGVPAADRPGVLRWSEEAFASSRPLATHQQLMQYLVALMDSRIEQPGDDIVTGLVLGTLGDDDEPLSEENVILGCENILGAAENAGLSMAAGMQAFLEHPDQWRRVGADRSLLPTAIEEILRWGSSARHSMRTTTAPTTLAGQELAAGDKVVVWLPSANRDECFGDPDRFDVARTPNRHLALGFGEHACIGAALARLEMRLLFSELLDRAPTIDLAGPIVPVRSIAVGGPAHLPVAFGWAAA